MTRFFKLISLVILFFNLSCRKDEIDIRHQFAGEYFMTYTAHSDVGGFATQDTTYSYLGTVTLNPNPALLDITGVGTIRLNKTTLELGTPTSISAYDASSSGYFIGDSIFHISAADSYWGHTWNWGVHGTRIN